MSLYSLWQCFIAKYPLPSFDFKLNEGERMSFTHGLKMLKNVKK